MFVARLDRIRLPLVLASVLFLAGCQTIDLETEFVPDVAV